MNGKCKHRWITGILAILLTLLSSSSGWTDSGKSCLWRVQSENNTVYLLGSVHFLTKEAYPLPAAYSQAFNESPIVVFETDINRLNTPEIQNRIVSLSFLPEGDHMQNHLSPDTYRLLTDRLLQEGIEPSRFEQLKPWMAALTLASIQLIKLGFHPQYGVDHYYFQKAGEEGKQIQTLESVDFQIDLISSLEGYDPNIVIEKTIQEMDILENFMEDMYLAWQSGDCLKLGRLNNQSFEGFPDLYENFISSRNKQWLPRILALTEQNQDVLVVVGAGHLCGKDSLIGLLAQTGIHVTQM